MQYLVDVSTSAQRCISQSGYVDKCCFLAETTNELRCMEELQRNVNDTFTADPFPLNPFHTETILTASFINSKSYSRKE